uniref:Uncharacterized protein n=1 Tax=Globodera rostochiensis TaxID=31243 RepID=A0A914IDA1_GLORO
MSKKTNLPKTLVAAIKLVVCLMFIQILARSDEVDAGKAHFAASDHDEPFVDNANSCTIRVQKVEKFQGKCIALKDGVNACQTSKYLDPSNADCSDFP